MDPETLVAHARGLRALARRLVGDAAAADDVVQEACLAALRREPGPGVPLRAWLKGVVRNLALRRRREEGRRADRERRVARDEAVPPGPDVLERAELHRALLDAVLGLEEPYRATLLLRYFDGLGHREIAARLGVPMGTVAARLHRGLELLRGRLDRRFGDRTGWCLALLPLLGADRSAAALTLGVVAMSTKKSAVLVALVLLLLGAVVGTLAWNRGGRDASPRAEGSAAPAPPPASTVSTGATLPPPVDLDAVDRDLDLHGVVVGPAGAPVAGASVQAFWYPWQRSWVGTGDFLYEEERGPGGRTASDGTFALRLERAQCVNLRVEADGFAPREISCLLAGERVRVVLGAGVRVVLECVDPAGDPVARAEVKLRRSEAESPGLNFVERRGTTGADGRCAFEGLPAGEWAWLEGRSARSGTVAIRRVVFPAAGEAVAHVRFPGARAIRGVVTDAGTGAPIAGARVGESWTIQRPVRTDAEGRYELWCGTDVRVYSEVGAAADGHEPASGAARDVLDFALVRGGNLRGRVVDAGGHPVAGALLSAQGRDETGKFATWLHGRTEPDGTFHLRGAACGIAATLSVLAPGHGRTLLDFDGPATADDTVDLGDVPVGAARRIEGRVLTHDGTPAPGIVLDLEGWNADRGRLRPDAAEPYRAGARKETRRTDDLGRFRFNDLAPGTYTLTCASFGWKPVPQEVTVPPDADVADVEVRLSGGHELAVHVEDTAGRPVAGVYVNAGLADDWWMQAPTDAGGRVLLHADAPFRTVSTWDAGTTPRRYAPLEAQAVPEGASEVRLVLAPVAVIEGVVLDLDGQPLVQAHMRVLRDGAPLSLDMGDPFSDMQGRFQVLVPSEGTVDLVLTGLLNRGPGEDADPRDFTGRLTGVAAGATGLVLRARPLVWDRTVEVRVTGPDGSVLRGAQVYAKRKGKNVPGANVLTDAEGCAVLRGLPDGEIALWARAVPGHPGAADWLDAVAAPVMPEGQTVALHLRDGLRIRGRVVDDEGAPVAEVYVTAYRGTEIAKSAQTDAEGRFDLLVAKDEVRPDKLVAQKWVGSVLWQAQIEGAAAEPGGEPAEIVLRPGE